MKRFIVDVEVEISLVANDFQQAADLARKIISGDSGKPDSAKINSVETSAVRAGTI